MITIHHFPGGVHPKEGKGGKTQMSCLPIQEAPLPSRVAIPLKQHIGAPCQPLVARGDHVKVGQMSAAVHASVAGTVVDCTPCLLADGTQQPCVIIDNDFSEEWVSLHPVSQPESLTMQQLSDLVREMGVVGMGGATFPSAVKLNISKKVDTLVLNGAECEPYLFKGF